MVQLDDAGGTPPGSLVPDRAPARILVVDDEPDTCEALRRVLELHGYGALAVTSAESALEAIGAEHFDLVLTDVNMDEMNGLELVQRILETRPALPVILVTGQGSMDTVIAALRVGARDFLKKPLGADDLVRAVSRALQQRQAPAGNATQPGRAAGLLSTLGIAGCESSAMRQLFELVMDLSESVASVVIQGETGTGKEVVARAIHANSRLSTGPFVAVNCAAIPAGLLESELFGHARGAFTGARTAKTGLLVQANGGTLPLDEIGELPLAMQPKLLRALQERRVRALGEAREIPFDCRVIAATNRDLDVEVSHKRFREDLYYRLDVVRLTVPPLRERGEDILLLARYFLQRLARGKRAVTLAPSTAEQLLAYDWPGNVRELENCIERAVALCRRDELGIADLPEKIRLVSRRPAWSVGTAPVVQPLRKLERRHILEAIKRSGGNKTLAAQCLGIDRSTLYRRLEEYDADDRSRDEARGTESMG